MRAGGVGGGPFHRGPGPAPLGLSVPARCGFGAVGAVPTAARLRTDAGLGVFVILAPLVFGFAAAIWPPCVPARMAEMGAALPIRRRSPAQRARHGSTGGRSMGHDALIAHAGRIVPRAVGPLMTTSAAPVATEGLRTSKSGFPGPDAMPRRSGKAPAVRVGSLGRDGVPGERGGRGHR